MGGGGVGKCTEYEVYILFLGISLPLAISSGWNIKACRYNDICDFLVRGGCSPEKDRLPMKASCEKYENREVCELPGC